MIIGNHDVYFKNTNEINSPELLLAEYDNIKIIKEHEINSGTFTVYYWATAKYDKVVLFTFTVQTALKKLPALQQEKEEVEQMIATFEFLSGEDHQHE